MRALKTRLLIGLLLVQLGAAPHIGCAQTSRSLQDRIPKPDPKKYQSVRYAKDWKNPYLIVRGDGIEILGMTPVGRAIAVESVPGVLDRLPDSAWPYGLVVAVQDTGIVAGRADLANIETNRTKLLNLLKGFGVAVDRWPSAQVLKHRNITNNPTSPADEELLVKSPVNNSYHAPVKYNPAFDYGDTVRISGGEHKGRIGAVVAINGSESSRTYTVEFGDGTDSEINEELLLDEDGLSSNSPT